MFAAITRNICALYLAAREPHVSPAAKWLIAAVIAYALSPIDLIPDFIPVIGYLDDLILLPLAIAIVIKMIPDQIWQDCLQRADRGQTIDSPHKRMAAALIILIWLLFAVYTGLVLRNWLA